MLLENEALKEELAKERALRQQLEWKLRQLLDKQFGPSSEKTHPDQLQLFAEAVQSVIAEETAAASSPEKADAAPAGKDQDKDKEKTKLKPRGKRTFFPEAMREEMIEILVPEGQRICPVTGAERKFVRWEQSIKIKWVAGHFVRVIIRREVRAASPGAGAELCPEPVVTAEMPPAYRIIPGAIAACSLLVHLIVSKYCDHIPFYRTEQIFRRRYGVVLERQTMCHWMKRTRPHLQELYEALLYELRQGGYLQMDETTIRLMDPDTKGKTKKSFFWVIKRPGHGVLFWFDPGRSHRVAEEMLGDFSGNLQTDGYSAYMTLCRKNPGLNLFACWSHARRKFYESIDANGPDAGWYMMEIQKLYRVETEARESRMSAEARSALRLQKSQPILASIKARLDADRARASILPSSPLGKAIEYTLGRWNALVRYADSGNGEVEIDNNWVENAIRPTAIGKKNWLFIGHPEAGQQSAILYTIIENCRLHEVNPVEYLEDVLPRIQ
ncbi:MAG: IS66 family transposase, partial [Verrucomicrobia bacterium]|nr:IS66 family transposase [Verrucomicrobiota bacterium]